MKKSFILIILLIFIGQVVLSQREILGKVVDGGGNGLMAATCFLRGDRSKVAISDLDGIWSMKISKSNEKDTVEIRYLGFETQLHTVQSFASHTQKMIQMGADKNMMSEIFITAKNPISEDFSVKKIEKLDVYFNPLSKGDPLNAIQMLPASTNTDESASPALRGSSSMRSIVIVEGVPIRNPVRFNQLNGTGNFSIFSTEMLKSQDVYAGNPPLVYGNSSAGLIDIKLSQKVDKEGFTLGANLAGLSAIYNKRLGSKNGFISTFANHGISAPFKFINGNSLSNINSFRNMDIGFRLYSQLSDNVTFSFFNYSTSEGYDVHYGLFAYQGNAIGDKIRNYTVAALEWGQDRNHWSINSGANISSSDFSYGIIQSDVDRKDFYSSLNYKRIEENFVFQLGINYTWNRDIFDQIFPVQFYNFNEDVESFTQSRLITQHDVQTYGYGKYYLGNFTLSAALRSNIPVAGQAHFLSRQMAVKYAPNDDHSILFSTGKYYNYNYPTSENLHQNLMHSIQYALEYKYTSENLQMTLAAYSKEEDNLFNRFTTNSDIPLGIRSIKGVEISIRKNIGKRFILDLANTFLDIDIDTGEFTYRASNDLKYFFKAGLTIFNNDVFNAGISYVTRPGKYYTDIAEGKPDGNLSFAPIFDSEINGVQYDDYSNISITFNRQILLPNDKTLTIYAVLNNLLNVKNPSYATYNIDYTSKNFEYLGQRWFIIGGMIDL
ncbi:MAG: TonB-dependent receptor plug domain-containing protein [Saprospiraceae bacterium]